MSTSALQEAGGYRVGDAERARTLDLLKEAHAAGYLTLDEVDERLTAALTARTRNELDRLVADLPPDWRARQEAGPVRRRAVAPVVWYLPLALLVVAMIVLGVATRGFFFPWPLLWLWFVFGRPHRHATRLPRRF